MMGETGIDVDAVEKRAKVNKTIESFVVLDLIGEIKACRKWRSTQEKGVKEVIEQRTKEACFDAGWEWIRTYFGDKERWHSTKPLKDIFQLRAYFKQAIDSVGKK